MGQKDPRVDAYIAKAAPFAQPLLTHLRACMHKACPDTEETIKWGMPFFMHGSRILANMAAFKAHCAFGFWHGRDAAGSGRDREAMGQFGRITSLADLPPRREFEATIREAAGRAIAAAGAPRPTKTAAAPPRPALAMPDDLAAALAANAAARRCYNTLAPSKQRDYVEWVLEAKRADTRRRRIAQAVAWMAEGKSRHWRYQA